jgi:hypothetical protein
MELLLQVMRGSGIGRVVVFITVWGRGGRVGEALWGRLAQGQEAGLGEGGGNVGLLAVLLREGQLVGGGQHLAEWASSTKLKILKVTIMKQTNPWDRTYVILMETDQIIISWRHTKPNVPEDITNPVLQETYQTIHY